jgi:fibronectin type III domain protein
VTSLKLAQRGDRLEIAYVAPRATTGGARLGVLDVEILRADAPGDFLKTAHRSRRKAAPGEALAETAPLPVAGTTVRVAARALERGHPSTVSSVATLVVQPPPPAPHDLVAELKGDAVALSWQGTVPEPAPSPSPTPPPSPTPSSAPSPRPPVAKGTAPLGARPSPSPSASPKPPARGFLIYRRREPAGHFASPIRSEPFTTNAFEDRAVSLGEQWCYVIATAVSTEPVVESARSNEACVSVRDIVPPAAPSGAAALPRADAIEISWSPSADADLASYRVYRQAPGGPRERVGEVAPPETSLRDTGALPGIAYVYTVTAVDRAGNESAASGAAPGRRE